MTEFPAGAIERNGIVVPIYVDELGRWLATVDVTGDDKSGITLRNSSRAELDQAIAKHTKRAVSKVSVPFTRLIRSTTYNGGTTLVMHGTATGVHGANGNVLVQWSPKRPGGKPVNAQLTSWRVNWNHAEFFRPLADEEIASYTQLSANLEAATEAHRKFIHRYSVDLKDEIFKKIDALKIDGHDD